MSELRQKMFPYVVPKSWVEYAGESSLVSWAFSEQVRMVLVSEAVASVRNIRPEDLNSAGISVDEAFSIAAENLAKAWQAGAFEFGVAELQDGVAVGMVRGNWMAPAGGLLLGNFHAALVEHFNVQEFAAVPANQETLIAFPPHEISLHSRSLASLVKEAFREHPKPISAAWLLLDGAWPRPFEGTELLSARWT